MFFNTEIRQCFALFNVYQGHYFQVVELYNVQVDDADQVDVEGRNGPLVDSDRLDVMKDGFGNFLWVTDIDTYWQRYYFKRLSKCN